MNLTLQAQLMAGPGMVAMLTCREVQLWTALIAGTWMGLLQLDFALRRAVNILILTRDSFKCASAVEDVAALVLVRSPPLHYTAHCLCFLGAATVA